MAKKDQKKQTATTSPKPNAQLFSELQDRIHELNNLLEDEKELTPRLEKQENYVEVRENSVTSLTQEEKSVTNESTFKQMRVQTAQE